MLKINVGSIELLRLTSIDSLSVVSICISSRYYPMYELTLMELRAAHVSYFPANFPPILIGLFNVAI